MSAEQVLAAELLKISAAQMRAHVDAHDSTAEGLVEAIAVHISGLAGHSWSLMDKRTRDGWRMAATEIVAFVREYPAVAS